MLLADDELTPEGLAISLAIFAVFMFLGFIFRGPTLGSGRHRRRFVTVPDLIREVQALTGLEGTYGGSLDAWFPKLDKFSFQGPLRGGRGARIRFHSVSDGSSTTNYVRLRVDCDEAPRIKLSRETPQTRRDKRKGLVAEIEIGHRAFDDRYLIVTVENVRARRVLADSPELRQAIDEVFGHRDGLTLSIDRGTLEVEATAGAIDPIDYPKILGALDRIARQFDRKKLQIRRLGAEKRALVDTSGKTRCPYCRAAIVGDEETLTACESCSTVLHEGCWDEHGGCPILGCAGGRPSSGRNRVRPT